eukprot:CAMPEP_0171072032 /NCGR_PEP_ID=MMETSP0766_2-20121228/10633_1 /TAXON_ID=439317 /ORGANISM="Gambierdiscus australes, Strain CAWD 149" /LENGTH=70 /DNA_ID=CAMNT_0011528591 /DNA_START=92 /DNA_END=304 /DNA_ORIENTATION=+
MQVGGLDAGHDPSGVEGLNAVHVSTSSPFSRVGWGWYTKFATACGILPPACDPIEPHEVPAVLCRLPEEV